MQEPARKGAEMDKHIRQDFSEWEQRATCRHCAKPLTDNDLVNEAHKMSTANSWAKSRLAILADMIESRDGNSFDIFLVKQLREVAQDLRTLK